MGEHSTRQSVQTLPGVEVVGASRLPRVSPDSDVAGKKLLILGAGLWQREYIHTARAMGVETWVTDWSADAVARDDADHFAHIDLRDAARTLTLARSVGVDGVMTAADVGVPTAAHVAGVLGLAGSPETLARQATHKQAMRERAAAIGLRCPWFETVASSGAAHSAMAHRAYPIVVKPVDNCSSRGVRVVEDSAALESAVIDALAASNERLVLLEEFLVGQEGSAEVFVQQRQPTLLGVCDKTKSPLPDRYDLELRYPGAYSPAVSRNIERFVARLVEGFAIADALIHIEFLVRQGTDDVYLVEFALRGCGSKVITHLLPQLTGIDVVAAAIRQALGLRASCLPRWTRHGALHFLLFPPGRVAAIHGVKEARALPGVIDLTIERAAGDVITETRDGRSRPGHLLVHGETRRGVAETIDAVRRAVRIEFHDGRSAGPLPMPYTT